VRSEPAGTATGTPASTAPPTRCWPGADQPRAGGRVHEHRPGRGQAAQCVARPMGCLPTRAARSHRVHRRPHRSRPLGDKSQIDPAAPRDQPKSSYNSAGAPGGADDSARANGDGL
jgi:hypothetical protein